ncbi:MAG: thioredoxin family protein [Elusimicrobia bacterium]|nr:thioredoxin family protein [Elusimicrobiota bacterium]
MNVRSLLSVLFLSVATVAAAAPEIGKPAPAFVLKDTHGKDVSLADQKGKVVVLEWINHGCPFVKKHYGSGNMQKLQKDYTAKGVVWLSVASSAPGKEGYMKADAWNKAIAEKKSAATAVLLDPDGVAGRAYGAKTTPHMFVIDAEGRLAYKGAIDDRPSADPADVPGAKNYVRQALDSVLAGKPVETASTTPYGCGVKFK